MRIAIVSESNGQIGGVETYLEAVMPSLLARGHSVAFFPGSDGPTHRPSLRLPEGVTRWPAAWDRSTEALATLSAWRPDVLFAHCLEDTELEAEVFSVAPTVFFAHAYYGTCISGLKSHWFPAPVACHRRFGPGCLAHYFPRRCGGLNPATALALYQKQTRRLQNLARCAAVLVLSEHMVAEYRRHDITAKELPPLLTANEESSSGLVTETDYSSPELDHELRIAFVGRLEKTKGPRLLLDALTQVASTLNLPVRCRLAGRGDQEAMLRACAAKISATEPRVAVEFLGWVSARQRHDLFHDTHLLAVPSRWPEPFGLVGLEAAAQGVPTVACAVGGVASWLDDEISGLLVGTVGGGCRPGDFAAAIVRMVRDPATYSRLREGALARWGRVDSNCHVDRLENILSAAARGALKGGQGYSETLGRAHP